MKKKEKKENKEIQTASIIMKVEHNDTELLRINETSLSGSPTMILSMLLGLMKTTWNRCRDNSEDNTTFIDFLEDVITNEKLLLSIDESKKAMKDKKE